MFTPRKKVFLTPYTTLKVRAGADFFAVIKDKDDLLVAIAWAREQRQPIFVLGGGSNTLFTKRFKGLVLKNEIKGIQITAETATEAWLTGNSGELWSHFVHEALAQKLYGLENLALIYGTVGAAPVQNIGAYGVELKDVFASLTAIDLQTGRQKVFSAAACHFGYRDSIFKHQARGRYFIYQVTVRLSKKARPQIDYAGIREILLAQGIKRPTPVQVVAAITKLRTAKLPNPATLPNAGSFFKNPEISVTQFRRLQKEYPALQGFPVGRKIKISAGWLIEQAGLKGQRFGNVGMYAQQALILVNYGGATATEVKRQAERVKRAVNKKFGLDLEPEVNII